MWFAAQLLFRAEYDPRSASYGSADERLWEERLVLIEAPNLEAAEHKAREVGMTEECAYVTGEGLPLTWKFDRVEQLNEVGDVPPTHGSELFSRFWRESELHLVRQSSDAEAYAESTVP